MRSETLAWFFVVAIFCFLSLFSTLHDFHLWPQVTLLRGTELDFSALLVRAHFLRYLLVYPIFLSADSFGLEADAIFNVICFFMLFFVTRNCVKTTQFYVSKNVVFLVFFFTFLFLTLSIFMNGRIIFAFCGFSYFLLSIHQWESYQIKDFGVVKRILISFFLCSVSTGAFLLCVICLLLWSTIVIQRPKGRLRAYTAILIAILSPLILFYIMKNVIFYGGGISGLFNMLNHGAGVLLYNLSLDLAWLVFFNFIILFYFSLIVFQHAKRYYLLFIFIIASMFGGLFGFSTLSLGIIPVSIISITIFLKSLLLVGAIKTRQLNL